jgi:integrase
MSKAEVPFCIFKREGRPYFYVQFKNEKTGKYMPAKSTKQASEAEALKTAWDWYTNGIPQNGNRDGSKVKISNAELIDTVKTAKLGKTEIKNMLKVWQQQGYIKTAVLTDEKSDRDFIEYLLEFWDFNRSPYIKEKLRRNHSIHKKYCIENTSRIIRHWQPVFSGRLLGTISRQDLETFIAKFDNLPELSARTKNLIIGNGITPLRYAFQRGFIDSDITQGITYFSGKLAERNILTPEQATALFAINWTNSMAKLANLLACLTGMRAGEILALRLQDLGENCIYIRHSWDRFDGLKTPKNNEERTVQIAFPQIMCALRSLAQANPHGQGLSGFVFYSDTLPDKPLAKTVLLRNLKVALRKIGMSEADSNKYVFHGWRHFYTAYK